MGNCNCCVIPFRQRQEEHIIIDLDDIFCENGYKKKTNIHFDLYWCNDYVKTIRCVRTKNTPIKIDSDFLSYCANLTTVDMSGLSNVTHIARSFLMSCPNLTFVNISGMSNLIEISNYFLNDNKSLTFVNLSGLSSITTIGEMFLAKCPKLTNVDFSGLANVIQIYDYFLHASNIQTINLSCFQRLKKIGDYFLSNCQCLESVVCEMPNVVEIGDSFLANCWNLKIVDFTSLLQIMLIGHSFLSNCIRLTTIIINKNCESIKLKVEHLNVNVEIKYCDFDFCNYNDDSEKIKRDKNFAKRLLNVLKIDCVEDDHISMIKLLEKENKKYNMKMKNEEMEKICVNTEEIFTLDKLVNIPKGRLIFLNKLKGGKYYCFDIINLTKFIFLQNGNFVNPYTNSSFTNEDIEKISNANIHKIKYFCEKS